MGALVQHVNRSSMRLLWRAYERAPGPLVKLMEHGRRVVNACGHLRVPLAWLRGRTHSGRDVTVLTAGGDGGAVDYFLARLFPQPPTRQSCRPVSLMRLRSTLFDMRADADLTLASVDRFASGWLFGDDYLSVPSWLLATVPVPQDMHELVKTKNTRSDLKAMQRNGLRPQVSHLPEDFDRFYHEMYVPFAQQRHGSASITRAAGFMRRYFRHGGLMWICEGEREVAGMLYGISGKTFQLVSLGTPGGSYEPAKHGAFAALYLYGAELAKASGCTTMDFGGTRLCAKDGVLLYKRKWGIAFEPKPDVRLNVLVRCPLSYRHR
jgi:hypothetical protein